MGLRDRSLITGRDRGYTTLGGASQVFPLQIGGSGNIFSHAKAGGCKIN